MENNWLVLPTTSCNVYHIFVWNNWLTIADYLICCMPYFCRSSYYAIWWFYLCLYSLCGVSSLCFIQAVCNSTFIFLVYSYVIVDFITFPAKRSTFFISSADGTATITATAPDTITQWITSAFAVNPVSGLGVASETAKVIYSIFR